MAERLLFGTVLDSLLGPKFEAPLFFDVRFATADDITAHVVALPPDERLSQLRAIITACSPGEPRPWRDGDERCHCTHCNGCGRLYRSADIEAHRDVCLIRQLAQRVRRDD